MREVTRKYIESLKQGIAGEAPFTGFRFTTDDGVECKLRFIGRGEVAYYQEGERALLFEAMAGTGLILARTIREWDTGKRVTAAERAAIVRHTSTALEALGNKTVTVVTK